MRKKPISEYPHMMNQWHPANDLKFDVNTTASGTRETALWRCSKCGYEWESLISTRKESRGCCPRCDKDKQGPETRITIAMVPNLMDNFDHEANPDIDPYRLTATRRIRANWKCSVCGHTWNADIHNRYYDNTGCPACSGKIVTESHNVFTRFPEIEKYYDYDHPGNPDLKALAPSSSTVVHWKCPDCEYKWAQPISFRFRNGKVMGCSICTGSRIHGTYEDEYPAAAEMYSPANPVLFKDLHAKDRTMALLWICPDCGYEFESTLGSMMRLADKPHHGCPACLGRVIAPPGRSIADLHPELLDELDDDTDLYRFLPYSRKKVNWKCHKCGYSWMTTIALRQMGYGKCPVCNNIRAVKGYNTVADLFVNIAKQWSPSNEYRPDELMPSSCKWVKLICPDCGGEHSVQVKQAADGNIRCPYCNDRFVLPGLNSFAVKHPDLLEEWDYVNNYVLADPDAVSEHSRIRVWFECMSDPSHGNYEMTIKNRVMYKLRGRNPCPVCKGRRRKKTHFV